MANDGCFEWWRVCCSIIYLRGDVFGRVWEVDSIGYWITLKDFSLNTHSARVWRISRLTQDGMVERLKTLLWTGGCSEGLDAFRFFSKHCCLIVD